MPEIEPVLCLHYRNTCGCRLVREEHLALIVPEDDLLVGVRMDDPPCETVRMPVESISVETLRSIIIRNGGDLFRLVSYACDVVVPVAVMA